MNLITSYGQGNQGLKKILPHILGVLFLAALIFGITTYVKLEELKKNPQKVAAQEVKELVAAVSRLIVLPQEEEPTVATVRQPELLKEQPFFAQATIGMKVLIYPIAKKAILYDPNTDKIVEVAPVNIGDANAAKPKR